MNLYNRIIAVDICNTIADVNSEIYKRLGINPDLSKYYHPKILELGGNEYFVKNLDIFEKAKPIKYAAEILHQLSKNNKIIYLTARPIEAKKITAEWLSEYKFPKSQIIYSDNKWNVAKKLNVSLAIDDAPKEIKKYKELNIPILIKKQPYNIHLSNKNIIFEWDKLYNLNVED